MRSTPSNFDGRGAGGEPKRASTSAVCEAKIRILIVAGQLPFALRFLQVAAAADTRSTNT
jgi:hypothetical protein